MKIYQVLTLSFLTSMLATSLVIIKMVTMWFDEQYVASLNLSPDADSLGIPIFGGVIFGMVALSLIIGLYIAWLVVFRMKHTLGATVRLRDASPKIKFGRISKTIVIGITLFLVGILYLPPFYEYVNVFYVFTDILSGAAGLLSGLFICLLIAGAEKKSDVGFEGPSVQV